MAQSFGILGPQHLGRPERGSVNRQATDIRRSTSLMLAEDGQVLIEYALALGIVIFSLWVLVETGTFAHGVSGLYFGWGAPLAQMNSMKKANNAGSGSAGMVQGLTSGHEERTPKGATSLHATQSRKAGQVENTDNKMRVEIDDPIARDELTASDELHPECRSLWSRLVYAPADGECPTAQ